MAKFGKIISSSTPTLIIFHLVNPSDDLVLDIANALGDKARVIKIDVDKNKQLVEALRIKTTPTFVIYKESEMKWRQSGEQKADFLIKLVRQFI